ncbi:MAG: hypothetical protein ABJG15_10195 [Hyphomonadaceae bacterium]
MGLVVFGQSLEVSPVTHMLVLLPGLAISGALLGIGLRVDRIQIDEANANGVILIAVGFIFFWMLPRYIDASLVTVTFGILKYLSIPIFVGVLMALGWGRANPYLRGFLKANALSMLGVLSFLYTHAPVRICNSYLVSAQENLGVAFLWTAIFLALVWSYPLFFPKASRSVLRQ